MFTVFMAAASVITHQTVVLLSKPLVKEVWQVYLDKDNNESHLIVR